MIAVGGTTLERVHDSARGWYESAWPGAGSICTKAPKPKWQTDVTQCSGKAFADVSANADPNDSPFAVYTSASGTTTLSNGQTVEIKPGWMGSGGTSEATPLVAGVIAQAGDLGNIPAQHIWENASKLNDVTTGSNGTCPTTVWCEAGVGWDGPTGLGTPNGTGAF